MANETSELKQQIRDASADELQQMLTNFKQEHFQLRLQAVTSALDNPKRIRFVKKAIARIETERTRRSKETAR